MNEENPLTPLGMPSLVADLGHWVPGANYVITGGPDSGAEALALTLAEKFELDGGRVIWIGVTDDLDRICTHLMFMKAGVEFDLTCAPLELDAIEKIFLSCARDRVRNMSASFCNVDECGDIDLEREFLASVSSSEPTLIVVEVSIFDGGALKASEVLVLQGHAQRMVEAVRRTNPMSSVLWQLPMRRTTAVGKTTQRPSLDDLPDAARVIKPEVVLFTNNNGGSTSKHNAELIVAANAFGPTGTVPMIFDSMSSTWHEFDAAA